MSVDGMDQAGMMESMGPSTITLVLFFGCITFATVGLATRSWLLDESQIFRLWYQNLIEKNKNESHYISTNNARDRTWIFLGFTTLLGCMVWLVYMIQNHALLGTIVKATPTDDEEKDVDLSTFLWLSFFLCSCVCSWNKNPPSKTKKQSPLEQQDEDFISVQSWDQQSKKSIGSNELQSILVDHNNGEFDTSNNQLTLRQKKKKNKKKSAPEENNEEEEEEKVVWSKQNNREIQTKQEQAFHYQVVAPVSVENDVLNVHQTLEWKGLLIATYFLFGYSENYRYYYELGTSCFVFLSGYGHAQYVQTTRDTSLTRVLQVAFRITFLQICFQLTDKQSWLIPYFYVWIVATIYVGETYFVPQTKFGMRWCGVGVALILLCLWDVLQLPISWWSESLLWSSVTHIHHWSFFIGMIFAWNHPINSLWVRKVESINSIYSRWSSKCIVLLAFLTALFYTTPSAKSMHQLSYFSFVPMLTYVYIRNFTPTLRSHTLKYYQHLGKYSLELYMVHTCLLKNGNYKLVPSYPMCNQILSLTFIYGIARLLHVILRILTSTVIPSPNNSKKNKKLPTSKSSNNQVWMPCVILVGVFSGLYFLSWFMKQQSVWNVGTLLSMKIILGILLYQTILDSISTSTQTSTTPIAKICPPLIGTLAVLVATIVSHSIMSNHSSIYQGKQMLLPSHCSEYLNQGQWSTLTTCNEHHRGSFTRNSPTSMIHDCQTMDKSTWGWTNTDDAGGSCHFSYKSPLQWQHVLSNHRNVIFMGDTIIRNLYQSTCRAIGDVTAQEQFYDSSIPLHSDITKTFGHSSTLKYIWAPLAMDCVAKLRELLSSSTNNEYQNNDVQLIVLSGGVWDRLHVWATDEDQESHKMAVMKLKKMMQQLQVSRNIKFVWVRPTTIHTAALNNAEKRSLMSEDNIQQMRVLYAQLGIDDVVDTVIDGPSFTSTKVQESYDGVHYPPYIYDVGTQLLGNALDWLLVDSTTNLPLDDELLSQSVKGNAFLGCMMFCFCLIGLLFYDGYFGFSYLASLFTRDNSIPVSNIVDFYTNDNDVHPFFFSVMPNDLYDEAMSDFYKQHNLKQPSLQPPRQDNNKEHYLDFIPSYPDNIENGDDESDAFTFFPQEKNSNNIF